MNLSSFVRRNMVSVNLRASTKRAAIAEIVGYICARRNLPNKNQILQGVLDREEKAATGIGDGVAIPHSRLPHLDTVLFFVGISKPGIDFGAPDGKAAHIIFLFVTPETESQTHLKILSAIGNLQQNRPLIERLIASRSDSELFDILNYEQVQRESYYPLTREEIFQELETTEGGLSEEEARSRLGVYGANRLQIVGASPLMRRLLRHLVDLPNLLLIAAAALGFAAGYGGLSLVVIALALLNTGLTFLRQFKRERILVALRSFVPQSCRVIRAGRERKLDTADLVPGDILLLDRGDVIPADGRLIETDNLRVDNSAFSGDSKPVHKSHDPGENREQFLWMEVPTLVFGGTTVAGGSGSAVVTATGMDTELGQTAYLTQSLRSEASPLRARAGRLSRLSALTLLALAAVGGLLVLTLGVHPTAALPHPALLALIGLILGLVAEGLVPAAMIVLLVAAGRLRRGGAVVKRLATIEALGTTGVVCTGTTGTLTKNEMRVRRLWLGGVVMEVEGEGYAPEGAFRDGERTISGVDLGNGDYRIFFYTAALCNNASLIPPGETRPAWSITGDPIEGALLSLVGKAGIDTPAIRAAYPVKQRFPFDSVRKRMSTHHTMPAGKGTRDLLLVKGAPHELLERCDRVRIDGRDRLLDAQTRQSIDEQIDRFADDGMRVLGFAYRRLTKRELENPTVDRLEGGLTLTGLTALSDPPQEAAEAAVRSCREMGIRVLMVTGEYQLTALSVARRLGIVDREAARVISGREVSDLSDEELGRLIEQPDVVFARVNPEHRRRIVALLAAQGESVAATGDAIGDAPVLRQAAVGVAMTGRANAVTRATADLVLSRDRFSDLVGALREGRAVTVGLRALVAHLSSHLLPEGLAFAAVLLAGLPLPLSLPLILAIDLVIDLIPSITVGLRRPSVPLSGDRVDGVERWRGALTRRFLLGGIAVSLLAGAAYLATARGLLPGANPASASTVYFLSLVAAQLVFLIAAWGPPSEPSSGPLGGSARSGLPLAGGAIATAGLSVAAVYLPAFNRLLDTTPPQGRDWLLVLGVALLAAIGTVVRGAIARRRATRPPRHEHRGS